VSYMEEIHSGHSWPRAVNITPLNGCQFAIVYKVYTSVTNGIFIFVTKVILLQ